MFFCRFIVDGVDSLMKCLANPNLGVSGRAITGMIESGQLNAANRHVIHAFCGHTQAKVRSAAKSHLELLDAAAGKDETSGRT